MNCTFAKFEGANFSGAKVDGANLVAFNLNLAVNLTEDQILSAFTERNLPSGFFEKTEQFLLELEIGKAWRNWRKQNGLSEYPELD